MVKPITPSNLFNLDKTEEERFDLLNGSIPAFVCSVLIRDSLHDISKEDLEFCKSVVLEYARLSINQSYQYQISDGVQPAISLLPAIFELFPENREEIKLILLFGMFNEFPVGGMISNQSFSVFPITAIHQLWEKNFDEAQSLLLGYLLIKPQLSITRKRIHEEDCKKGIYNHQEHQVRSEERRVGKEC